MNKIGKEEVGEGGPKVMEFPVRVRLLVDVLLFFPLNSKSLSICTLSSSLELSFVFDHIEN